jgi:pyridoxal phosphate enzyme (YggS family)
MRELSSRLQAIQDRIAAATVAAGRPPGAVVLLAVSKTHPADDIRTLHACGQRAFGENYLQEAEAKMAALTDLAIEWHHIGRIQSNKTRAIAAAFHWVHGIAELHHAERLAAQRPPGLAPLNLCIQVNVSAEPSKAGVPVTAVEPLARAIATLPNLRLRGLMAIPEPCDDPVAQRRPFRALRELRDRLQAAGLEMDTLSMGMSDDLEAAILEGATLVRVGTALFGPRPPPRQP